MTKEAIIEQMEVNHRNFLSVFVNMNDEDFMYAIDGKWTAGQQLDHIRRSVRPLRILLTLPNWMTKVFLKKANRPSRSFEELIEKYKRKLMEGGKASGNFVPEKVTISSKPELLKKVESEVLKLNASLQKYSEQEFDQLVIPHPLLGYLTLREMMYFTIYHAEHHRNLTVRNLENKNKI